MFSLQGNCSIFCRHCLFPASIYGIIPLFLALENKLIKVKHIRENQQFLIAIMPVMFIPAAVGLIDSYQGYRQCMVPYRGYGGKHLSS